MKALRSQDAGSTSGFKRSVVHIEWERKKSRCMELIEGVVSRYKRKDIVAAPAMHEIQCILDHVDLIDDDVSVPAGNTIIIPPHQLAPWALRSMSPSWLSAVTASAIPPQETVGEAAGHGCGP